MKILALKRVGFYLTSDIVSKLAPFIILPYIANGLGIVEFGIYSLLLTISLTFSIFIGFNTQNALSIYFFRKKRGWSRLGRGLFNIWLYSFAFLSIASLFFFSLHWVRVTWLSALIAYCTWNFQLLITVLQFKESLLLYAIAQVFRSVVLSLIPASVVYYGHPDAIDAYLIFIYLTLANIIVYIFTIYIFNHVGFFKEKPELRKSIIIWALKFSIPTVLNASSGWARASFDRYILVTLVGTAALGIYSLGFQYGSIVGVVGISISRVSTNILLKCLNNKLIPRLKRVEGSLRIIRGFVLLNFFVLLIFFAFIYFGQTIFFPKAFEHSVWVSYIVGIAFFFQSCASLATPCIQFISKNSFLGFLAIGLSIVSLFLVFFSIKLAAHTGASIAFLFVWVLHAGISLMWVHKFLKIWANTRLSQ
ncbi:oligosaccharide flippase family protein [Limnohabitans sp. 2KL-1]|uniref:oligosaccharide flippase family protein n=1 Tax=Limnohabitans sp. 2KL-1 TaxID=1100699 RepID=UPI0013049231|nr:oligosaccharide flippase family protein [Limnohabitans sp. 2KL-1]